METNLDFLPKTLNIRKLFLQESEGFFFLFGTDKCNRKQQILTVIKYDDTRRNYSLKDILIEDKHTFEGEAFDDHIAEMHARFSPLTTRVLKAYGLLGFVRFLKGYYMVLITSRKRVAKLFKHSIYQVKDMQLVPMFRETSRQNRDDENRYLNYFQQINISEGFYFSYTYDLTRSLQENILRKVQKKENSTEQAQESMVFLEQFNTMTDQADMYAHDFFEGRQQTQIQEHKPWENQMMWNYFLVREMYEIVARKKWVMPVIHGHIDFCNFVEAANRFTLILIARRSRHYAGTRFLRRGINQEGRPANFVEVEQIVLRHSSFCDDKAPMMSSFVQIRGSIPLFWSQIPNALTPVPDIVVEKQKDVNWASSKKHFGRLFQKYSSPLFCLNLTKAKNQREESVASEYRTFVGKILNKELPYDFQVNYIDWDMKEKKKNKTKKYQLDMLEHAQRMIKQTSFFTCLPTASGSSIQSSIQIQRGVIRTNCIDSLDRTNQVQTLLGYYASLQQLFRLGLLKEAKPDIDSAYYRTICQLYEEMGDQISQQYGGSNAHKAATQKKGLFATLGDTFTKRQTEIKRYLANTFTDPQKQNSVNLFLGIYQPLKHKKALWLIEGDRDLLQTMDKVIEERMPDRWWEKHFKAFEANLPMKLTRDLTPIFAQSTYFSDSPSKKGVFYNREFNPLLNSQLTVDHSSILEERMSQRLPTDLSFDQVDDFNNFSQFLPHRQKRQTDTSFTNSRLRPSSSFSNSQLSKNPRQSILRTLQHTVRKQDKNKVVKASDILLNDSDFDEEELQQHCHSDVDEFLDQDPYQEYNKSHQLSFLETKCEEKIHKFEPVSFSKLTLPQPIFERPTQDIVQETEILLREKFHNIMRPIVEAEEVINGGQKQIFERYLKDISNIAEQDFIKPTTINYQELPTSSTVRKDLLADLEEFNKYMCFKPQELTANKIREELVCSFNETTPQQAPDQLLEFSSQQNFMDDEFNLVETRQSSTRPETVTQQQDKSIDQLAQEHCSQLKQIQESFKLISGLNPETHLPSIATQPTSLEISYHLNQSSPLLQRETSDLVGVEQAFSRSYDNGCTIITQTDSRTVRVHHQNKEADEFEILDVQTEAQKHKTGSEILLSYQQLERVDQVRRDQNDAKLRLNSKEPQFPPDTYFIKKSPNLLEKHLNDPQGVKKLSVRATPNQRQRYRLFSLQTKDLEQLRDSIDAEHKISKKDYWHKKSTNLPEFQMMYSAIRDTDDILERFKNSETRIVDNYRKEQIQETYKTINDRFYNPRKTTTTKMGESLKKMVLDLANTTKHERVRRNKVEKAKLDYIDRELQQSPKLKEVETEQQAFEFQTSSSFTAQITHEFNTMRVDEMVKESLGAKRFSRKPLIEEPKTAQQKEVQKMYEQKMLDSVSNFQIQPQQERDDDLKSQKSVFSSERRLFVLSPKQMGLGSVKRASLRHNLVSRHQESKDSGECFTLPPLNENSICLTTRSGINSQSVQFDV